MPKKINEVINENENPVIVAEVKVEPKIEPTNTSATEQRVESKAEQMKAILDSQPKVSILIPLERGERKGAKQSFCINGYRFEIPKGQMTVVAEQVAQMVSERFNVELDVRSQSIENRNSDAKEALNAL